MKKILLIVILILFVDFGLESKVMGAMGGSTVEADDVNTHPLRNIAIFIVILVVSGYGPGLFAIKEEGFLIGGE